MQYLPTLKFPITNLTPLKENSNMAALSARREKHRQECWRTSSLSVPYALEGSGIILFLGGERTRARTCTHPLRGSNSISEHPLCLPIHLAQYTFTQVHKSVRWQTHTCFSHSSTHKKKLSLISPIDRPQWIYLCNIAYSHTLCCRFNFKCIKFPHFPLI